MTRIKLGIVALVPVACLLAMPSFVHGDIIASQTISTFEGTADLSASTADSYQYLGTGFSGTLDFIKYKARAVTCTLGSCPQIRINLIAATSSSLYSLMNGTPTTISTMGTGLTAQTYIASSTSPFTFSVSTHYFLVPICNTGCSDDAHMYGSAANVYAQGDYSSTPYSGIADLYFEIYGEANYASERFTIITPEYADVVPSANNVNFSYTYFINSLAYDKAGFVLVDNTTQQNINVSSLEEDINASGLSTFSDYFDLIHGHVYSWTPYLRNSSTDAYTYGSTTPFFAGAKTNMSIPEQPTPLWNGCTNILCQGGIFSTSTGILTWNGGTTTTPFGPFGETLDDLLRNKAPFSYLYDLKQLLYELGNGSAANTYSASCSNSDAYYTLPSGSLGTTLSNGSTTIKFIDACAIREMTVVQEIRRAITYALYLITGIGLAGMAMSAI